MSLCVIDGDLIAYKASAASEKRTILVTHGASGRSKSFDNRTVFKGWLANNEKFTLEDFTIEDVQTPEPVENCLHTVKQMLKGIQEASGCSEMKVIVQGDGNFRDDLLLPTKYKSNRSDMIRPIHLAEAKNYLLGKYKAEQSMGRESDDVLSSYAWEGYKAKKKIVQCTIDKDANQCAGWLFNWEKMSAPEFIQGLGELHLDEKGKLRGKGRKWLYVQSTIGDPSDCYKPTELTSARYGEKTAFKDFAELQTDKECWEKMVELYKSWYPDVVEYTAWDGQLMKASYLDVMQMYVDCAHMQRFDGDRLNVKVTLQRLGVNE